MSSTVAIVIPIYKEEIDELEKISLMQVRKVLGKYPLIFIAPEGKNFSYLEPGDMLVQFHPQYFQSGRTYSRLLLSPFFYEPFLVFDYILIYQLDAFVFYDALEDFCSLEYDYIGAPWPVSWCCTRVGNGGLSLRRVKACHKLVSENVSGWTASGDVIVNAPHDNFFRQYGIVSNSEDSFFAYWGASDNFDFKTASVEVAEIFAMEHYPDRCLKRLKQKLPFGCHGWLRLSADFYVKLFMQFGYDLRPLRDQMQTKDYEFYLPRSLEMIAMERLIRYLDSKKSVIQCLPTKQFSSICVIRSAGAFKILSRLLQEENYLTDKIFIYDKKNSRDLIHDLSKENLPHLVISEIQDKSLITAIENKGLTYGEHIISFRMEYIRVQEKLFHKLGK